MTETTINNQINQNNVLNNALVAEIQQQTNRAKSVVPNTQSSVVSASGKAAPTAGNALATPPVPAPSGNNTGVDLSDPQNMSIIAICAQVLCLEAKSSSNYWSNLYNSTTESMNAGLALAPIQAQATIRNWNAQSAATQDEADMSKEDGWISFTSGLGAIGMGMYSSWSTETPPNNVGATNLTNTDPAAVNPAAPAPLDPAAAAPQPVDPNAQPQVDANGQPANNAANANQAQQAQDDSLWNKIKKTGNAVKTTAGNVLGSAFKGFKAAAESAQMLQLVAQGGQGIFVDSRYKSDMAKQQKISGNNQATSQMAEAFAQYAQQNSSRQQDLGQSAQSNIDSSMQILSGIVSSVSSAVGAMYRG